MKYCIECVQPDTRPGIHFENGVCGACLYEEEKKKINWDDRLSELWDTVYWAKSHGSQYDCVVGVSGGKDSTFQALYARDVLDIHPLLVNSEPEGITDIGSNNIENLKQLGFDTIALRPNPRVMKQLIRKDFFEMMNPLKVTEFSLYASAYIVADMMDIPLIIQGDNPALVLGARNTGVGNTGDAMKASAMNTLSTGWERYIGNGITKRDLWMFHYDVESLSKKGIKAIWLQYYLKDWSQSHNARFSINHGLTIRENFDPCDIGTYSPYFQLDGRFNIVHQFIKYLKLGFGQCTDHACYDIRDGLITREQGVELVKKYDGKINIKFVKELCGYMDISLAQFWKETDGWRSKDAWERYNGEWKLIGSI